MSTKKVEITHRFSGAVLFVASIVTANVMGPREELGAAVRQAISVGANLRGANLRAADLRSADLYGANLRSADLYGANLRSADLYGANLGAANLGAANLRGANLRGADLYGADLYGADLYGADLYGANLRGAKEVPPLVLALTLVCPQEGAFTAFKKLANGTVAKLLIPAEARRSSATGRKCRAEFATVLEGEGPSIHDGNFHYRPGETVRPDRWHEDRWEECAPGIHFFMTREEAEAYC